MNPKMQTALFLLAMMCPAIFLGAQQEVPQKVIPAINTIEPWQQVGQQPYEMTWVQRKQNPHTLVGFEDMEGWTLQLFDGARGELRRSREQQIWGEHVCKILYAGASPRSHVIARPPSRFRFPGI